MLLMLKDTAVMKVLVTDDRSECELYREDLLPHFLKGKIKTPDTTGSMRTYLKCVSDNDMFLKDFLSQRVLPVSRKNAEKLYRLVTDDPHNKLQVAKLCHGVSLSDNFWIREEQEDLAWKDVSIRDHPLNEIFTQAALRGTAFTLNGPICDPVCTPELTTDGAYAKGWKRENGELYLYKKGYESHLEVMVSHLLDCLEIPHAAYYDAQDNGEYCCKCKCLSDDSTGMVDAGIAEGFLNRADASFLATLFQYYGRELYMMWIADYLTANSDRHSRNWGFFFDADTTKLQGLHPLFDHNNAFDTDLMYHPDTKYIAYSRFSMREAAHYAWKRCTINTAYHFTKEDFMTGRQYKCFTERLEELKCS